MKTDSARVDPKPDQWMHVSPEERDQMIAVAAYYRAEQRGFLPGQELQDWWEAAAVIDQMLDRMYLTRVTRRHYERVGLRNALRIWLE